MEAPIVYEDARLLVCDKPAGVPVVPGRGPSPEPLKAALERRTATAVFVVHRIDSGASGLVIFSKDPRAHRALCLQFERRLARKTYLAAVEGVILDPGVIRSPIKEYGSGRMGVHPEGKPSRTSFRVLEGLPSASLLEVHPATGRRHQIRVHLYSIGHPILGDTRYGRSRPVGGAPRLMLHALELGIEGPDGRPMHFRAEPPPDFISELDRIRKGGPPCAA
jgi:RluA family pseudouridine synthase